MITLVQPLISFYNLSMFDRLFVRILLDKTGQAVVVVSELNDLTGQAVVVLSELSDSPQWQESEPRNFRTCPLFLPTTSCSFWSGKKVAM